MCFAIYQMYDKLILCIEGGGMNLWIYILGFINVL